MKSHLLFCINITMRWGGFQEQVTINVRKIYLFSCLLINLGIKDPYSSSLVFMKRTIILYNLCTCGVHYIPCSLYLIFLYNFIQWKIWINKNYSIVYIQLNIIKEKGNMFWNNMKLSIALLCHSVFFYKKIELAL